jgi:phosphatidate cytidylyltransferase
VWDPSAPEPPPVEQFSAPGSGRGPSRAGRNLPAAIGVGVGLAGLVLATLYTVKEAFVGLVVVAVVLGVWELSTALRVRDVQVPVAPALTGAVAMVLAAYVGGPEALVVALAVTLLAIAAWRVTLGPPNYHRDVTAGMFAVLYVAFLASFAMLMARPEDGPERVVVFVLVSAFSDIGGYASGVFLGKHPMAPTVSPRKSWEGAAGSLVLAAAAGALGVTLLLQGAWWHGTLVGLAAVCTATLGDLGESLIKRDLGIKDMGSLLPGHGGLLDRIDSLLPTAPVVYLLLALFVPVTAVP